MPTKNRFELQEFSPGNDGGLGAWIRRKPNGVATKVSTDLEFEPSENGQLRWSAEGERHHGAISGTDGIWVSKPDKRSGSGLTLAMRPSVDTEPDALAGRWMTWLIVSKDDTSQRSVLVGETEFIRSVNGDAACIVSSRMGRGPAYRLGKPQSGALTLLSDFNGFVVDSKACVSVANDGWVSSESLNLKHGALLTFRGWLGASDNMVLALITTTKRTGMLVMRRVLDTPSPRIGGQYSMYTLGQTDSNWGSVNLDEQQGEVRRGSECGCWLDARIIDLTLDDTLRDGTFEEWYFTKSFRGSDRVGLAGWRGIGMGPPEHATAGLMYLGSTAHLGSLVPNETDGGFAVWVWHPPGTIPAPSSASSLLKPTTEEPCPAYQY